VPGAIQAGTAGLPCRLFIADREAEFQHFQSGKLVDQRIQWSTSG
jgi:hypothetical protein